MIESRYKPIIILFLLGGTVISFLTSLFALQLFVVILFVMWLFEKNADKKQTFDHFSLLVLLFGFARILSILFSEYPEISYDSFHKELIFYLSAIVFNFYFKSLNENHFKILLNVFVYSAVLVAVIGLIRFNLEQVHRAQSFISGYATFSAFLLVALGFYLVWQKDLLNDHWILFSFKSGIILAGLVTSLGRMNIAIALLLLSITVLLKFSNFRKIFLILFITILLSGISFQNNSGEFSKRTENVASMSDRDIIYKGFFTIFEEHPILGFGPRTFKEIFPIYDQFADQGIGGWHNEYIQVYMESGLLGFTVFLILIVSLLHTVVAIYRKRKFNDELGNLSFAFGLGLIALLISALTDGFITSPIMAIVFSFLIAGNSRNYYSNTIL